MCKSVTRKRFPGGTSYEAQSEAIVQMIGRSRVCKNFAQHQFEDFHYGSSIPSFRVKLCLKAVIPTVLTSLYHYQSFVFESFQCHGSGFQIPSSSSGNKGRERLMETLFHLFTSQWKISFFLLLYKGFSESRERKTLGWRRGSFRPDNRELKNHDDDFVDDDRK